MPELKIKFDRHGLGDCVHFAHALQLYKRRGYDVTVQVEENKLFVWKVAGVNIVQGGDLPDHSYHYPAGFDDLTRSDHETNKVAFGLCHEIMPRLADINLTPETAWDELCGVRLSAREFISPEAHAEADQFLEGMPRPIICFHSRGTNWHERKSIPTDVAFDTIVKLLDQTGGSVIVLDFDRRAPMVGDARCKGIKPSWGHIDVERLCALLERSDLMIGVDSGPFHLAAMTKVKVLGVFRSLHPNRVCLPNPNATYLAPAAESDQWDKRRPLWRITECLGTEPTVDDILVAARTALNEKAVVSINDGSESLQQCAGRYLYRRVGYDERQMVLESNGTISVGRDGCEQQWCAGQTNNGSVISISGKDGVICRLTRGNDGVFRGHWTQFERMPIELVPSAECRPSKPTEIPGAYFLEFIGDKEFAVKLLPNGGVESEIWTFWTLKDDTLTIGKSKNAKFDFRRDADGCWRGQAFGLETELIKADRQPFRSFGPTDPIAFKERQFIYGTMQEFSADCIELARRLRPITAVAGVPRSGVLAASLMALELNCPLLPIESLLSGSIPELPVPRRGQQCRYAASGRILVVDDNSHSGRVIRRLRPQLHPSIEIAVIAGNMDIEHAARPDHCLRSMVKDVFTSYEWTLFHDSNAEFTITDLDGVLCPDWTGGDESTNETAYLDFLRGSRPCRVPSYRLQAIVTNRLEKHRPETEEWLDRNGIRFKQLIMSPHATFRERDAAGDSARRKAEAYQAEQNARLFVESCGKQAREIKALTGRPVLFICDNSLV